MGLFPAQLCYMLYYQNVQRYRVKLVFSSFCEMFLFVLMLLCVTQCMMWGLSTSFLTADIWKSISSYHIKTAVSISGTRSYKATPSQIILREKTLNLMITKTRLHCNPFSCKHYPLLTAEKIVFARSTKRKSL